VANDDSTEEKDGTEIVNRVKGNSRDKESCEHDKLT